MDKNIVREVSESDFFNYPDQLIALYILAFGGPPYFEAFRFEEIESMARDYWYKNGDGIVLACINPKTKQLKGFFAGHNLALETDICQVLDEQINCPAHEYFYMAEIAVHPSSQKRGLAYLLVQEALSKRKGKYKKFIVRTNMENQPSIKLFTKSGFKLWNGASEIIEKERTDGKIGQDKRLFLTLNL